MALRLTPRQTLDALIDLFVPDIRSAFLAAIQDVVDNTLIVELVKYIEMGEVEGAFQALGFSPAAMRPLTAAIERAFEQGGVMTGRTFPKYLNTASGRGVFRFDVRNSRAEAWLRDHSSELITRIADDTRVNVRNVLTVGMTEGRNPRNVALDLIGRIDASGQRSGGIVGLSRNQEYWVRNTRQKLVDLDRAYFKRELRDKRFDGTVLKAIESKTPLPPDVVDKLVGRYKDNALKFRGESIARTEAMQSLNRAEWEAHKQAADLGAIKAENIKREWDSAGDTRVRPSHEAMDGQKRGLEEPFTSGNGSLMMHPGDTSLGAGPEDVINCRCRVRTVADWLNDLD